MSHQPSSTRQRLIQAALQLFAAQGITETTTRQIAELADVNEVTLFRQFGNKHGLLLAVIEDTRIFTRLGESLGQTANDADDVAQAFSTYGGKCLQKLDQMPELVRSLIGEAGKYSLENRQALGHGLNQVNHYTAQYLATVLQEQSLDYFSVEKLAGFLNLALLGYAMLELTSEFHQLWGDRHDFITDLVKLLLRGSMLASEQPGDRSTLDKPDDTNEVQPGLASPKQSTADLPASLVHVILQRAKKLDTQDYALAYVLFGAGLSPSEVSGLRRSHYVQDIHQHLLQINQGTFRQVPLNQWIMGQRYGSATRNPLTQWLKTRKDTQSALFLNEAGSPISEVELRLRWQIWVENLTTPSGQSLQIEQARQTWCVEMLLKGMSLDGLSILSGWAVTQLQPYVQRAREKAALQQAVQLDQKPKAKLVPPAGQDPEGF
ncbi:MAG: TetR family transcriptional regulator [Leptolyngbyaceae cyanobacterium RM2_2_4]|nr:TetR family transcriptional regulator [Leptolyngbyaceae cyanobacterium SM1_4_3]NJO49514.1 TetR family transcriptional regulator [Leptolyngbyaceae cyanobacterium RM2_2_4]